MLCVLVSLECRYSDLRQSILKMNEIPIKVSYILQFSYMLQCYRSITNGALEEETAYKRFYRFCSGNFDVKNGRIREKN